MYDAISLSGLLSIASSLYEYIHFSKCLIISLHRLLVPFQPWCIYMLVFTQSSDGKVEFVVRVADHAGHLESVSIRFLYVSIRNAHHVRLKTPSISSCSHSPFGCWRSMINYRDSPHQ